MKITIEEKQKGLNRVYPYLGKEEALNLIVAFTAPETGVVIEVGSSTKWELNKSFDSWAESYFTPMHPHPQPEQEPAPIPLNERKYPYVGKDEFEQFILFTAPKTGMLIKEAIPHISNPLGGVGGWAESRFAPIPNISRIIIDLES